MTENLSLIPAGTASFSEDGVYRYELTRSLGRGRGGGADRTVAVCMLNPSTADASVNDPTVRRVTMWSGKAGYTMLVVLNAFAYRATDPKAMMSAEDPIGPENDSYLGLWFSRADTLIFAWGVHCAHLQRNLAVLEIAKALEVQPYCFAITAGGAPGHPLYLASPFRTKPWPEYYDYPTTRPQAQAVVDYR